jgi:hypothetical protein
MELGTMYLKVGLVDSLRSVMELTILQKYRVNGHPITDILCGGINILFQFRKEITVYLRA